MKTGIVSGILGRTTLPLILKPHTWQLLEEGRSETTDAHLIFVTSTHGSEAIVTKSGARLEGPLLWTVRPTDSPQDAESKIRAAVAAMNETRKREAPVFLAWWVLFSCVLSVVTGATFGAGDGFAWAPALIVMVLTLSVFAGGTILNARPSPLPRAIFVKQEVKFAFPGARRDSGGDFWIAELGDSDGDGGDGGD